MAAHGKLGQLPIACLTFLTIRLSRWETGKDPGGNQGQESSDEGSDEEKRDVRKPTNGTVFKRPMEFVPDSHGTVWGLWVSSDAMWDSLDTPPSVPIPTNVRRVRSPWSTF